MSFNQSIYTRLDHPWSGEILDSNGIPFPAGGLSYKEMRDRSRRLERESSMAYGILDRAVENVIGAGIGIQPKAGAVVGEPTEAEKEFNKQAEDLWTEWTSGKQADVRRMYSFPKLQRLAHRAMLRDGDCGFVLIDRMEQGMRWPELQFIEGDKIVTPSGVTSSRMFEGVEFNDYNAPVAFWIGGPRNTQTRVEARDFVFLHNTVRYNVGRGEPRFHGTYRLFDQLEGHIEAVVVAARIAACQALIIKKMNPAQTLGRLEKGVGENGKAVRYKEVSPGGIMYLEPGEDVSTLTPNQPHQDFKGFITTIARMLGLKFGLTVERILMDFSMANYSVSRSTALQEIRAAEPEQQEFDASFFARVYPWFISKMWNAGRIKGPKPENMWAYDWIPQGRPLVEPSNEAAGLQKLIAMGVETPENIAVSMGYNWPKLLATLNKNKAELAALGLTLTGLPLASPTAAPSAA